MGSEGCVTDHVEVSHAPAAAHECIKSENPSSGSPLKSSRTEPGVHFIHPPHSFSFSTSYIILSDLGTHKRHKWPPRTCCFIRNTCSSSALISLSWTSCEDRKKQRVIPSALQGERSARKCSSCSYFSYRRLHDKIFEWIFGPDCC